MKKFLIKSCCLSLALLVSTVPTSYAKSLSQSLSGYSDNPITFSLASMPNGLARGTFDINMHDVGGYYNSSGPVNNQDNRYGLMGSLNDVNESIHEDTYNGEHIYNFGLSLDITLICSNQASVTYRYDATDVRTKGSIILQPPANCG